MIVPGAPSAQRSIVASTPVNADESFRSLGLSPSPIRTEGGDIICLCILSLNYRVRNLINCPFFSDSKRITEHEQDSFYFSPLDKTIEVLPLGSPPVTRNSHRDRKMSAMPSGKHMLCFAFC